METMNVVIIAVATYALGYFTNVYVSKIYGWFIMFYGECMYFCTNYEGIEVEDDDTIVYDFGPRCHRYHQCKDCGKYFRKTRVRARTRV